MESFHVNQTKFSLQTSGLRQIYNFKKLSARHFCFKQMKESSMINLHNKKWDVNFQELWAYAYNNEKKEIILNSL